MSVIPGMIEQLPCASCTAICCGPVPISEARSTRIVEHLRSTISAQERKRLAMQKRGDLDCRFLDEENYRCTIYPIRPWVCEAFGRVKGMQCPKVSGLVQIIPSIIADTKMEQEISTPIVARSDRWNWKMMDFD